MDRLMTLNYAKHISFSLIFFLMFTSFGSADISDLEVSLIEASDSAVKIAQNALDKNKSGQLAALFTDDAVVTGKHGRTIKGNFTIRATLAMLLMVAGKSDISVDRQSLELKDSVGYEQGSFIFKQYREDIVSRTYEGVYNAVWKLEEGVWKIDSAEGNDKLTSKKEGK